MIDQRHELTVAVNTVMHVQTGGVASARRWTEIDEFIVIATALGLSRGDSSRFDSDLQIHEISLPQHGLRLTFEDEGVFLDREDHDPGEGPFVPTECTFWGYEGSTQMYWGDLWKGIDFNDSSEHVLKKPVNLSKLIKKVAFILGCILISKQP